MGLASSSAARFGPALLRSKALGRGTTTRESASPEFSSPSTFEVDASTCTGLPEPTVAPLLPFQRLQRLAPRSTAPGWFTRGRPWGSPISRAGARPVLGARVGSGETRSGRVRLAPATCAGPDISPVDVPAGASCRNGSCAFRVEGRSEETARLSRNVGYDPLHEQPACQLGNSGDRWPESAQRDRRRGGYPVWSRRIAAGPGAGDALDPARPPCGRSRRRRRGEGGPAPQFAPCQARKRALGRRARAASPARSLCSPKRFWTA